jgi:hypothetical protein
LGRWSKEKITRKSPISGPSLAPHPHAGKREQGRAVPSHFPILTPADRQGRGKSRQIIKTSVIILSFAQVGRTEPIFSSNRV